MHRIFDNWTNIAALIVAFTALLVSFCSFIVSFRAFRLAQRQDDRRLPSLVPSLLNGYVQSRGEARVYAFRLSISNTSDSNNALAKLELSITYKTPSQTVVTTHVPSHESREEAIAGLPDVSALSTPARLDAHQTLAGWAIFVVPKAILDNATIEGYSLILFDSHGIKTSVEPIMISEYFSENISALREDPSPQ